MWAAPGFDAIIVAGGSGRRLGGVDKALLEVDGVSLLERVLAGAEPAQRVIVVGPTRPIGGERVIWCRELPPGGGPVAGLAAGLLEARAEVVLTLAVDLPWIAPAVPSLRATLGAATHRADPADPNTPAAAVLVDESGRPNYLAAAWRRLALIDAIATLDQVDGAALRTVFDAVRWVGVPDRDGWGRDIDQPGDLPD